MWRKSSESGRRALPCVDLLTGVVMVALDTPHET